MARPRAEELLTQVQGGRERAASAGSYGKLPPDGASPPRQAPERELSSGSGFSPPPPGPPPTEAHSILTHLLEVSGKSPGQRPLCLSGHVSGWCPLQPDTLLCLKLKEAEPGSTGKGWKMSIKSVSTASSHSS